MDTIAEIATKAHQKATIGAAMPGMLRVWGGERHFCPRTSRDQVQLSFGQSHALARTRLPTATDIQCCRRLNKGAREPLTDYNGESVVPVSEDSMIFFATGGESRPGEESSLGHGFSTSDVNRSSAASCCDTSMSSAASNAATEMQEQLSRMHPAKAQELRRARRKELRWAATEEASERAEKLDLARSKLHIATAMSPRDLNRRPALESAIRFAEGVGQADVASRCLLPLIGEARRLLSSMANPFLTSWSDFMQRGDRGPDSLAAVDATALPAAPRRVLLPHSPPSKQTALAPWRGVASDLDLGQDRDVLLCSPATLCDHSQKRDSSAATAAILSATSSSSSSSSSDPHAAAVARFGLLSSAVTESAAPPLATALVTPSRGTNKRETEPSCGFGGGGGGGGGGRRVMTGIDGHAFVRMSISRGQQQGGSRDSGSDDGGDEGIEDASGARHISMAAFTLQLEGAVKRGNVAADAAAVTAAEAAAAAAGSFGGQTPPAWADFRARVRDGGGSPLRPFESAEAAVSTPPRNCSEAGGVGGAGELTSGGAGLSPWGATSSQGTAAGSSPGGDPAGSDRSLGVCWEDFSTTTATGNGNGNGNGGSRRRKGTGQRRKTGTAAPQWWPANCVQLWAEIKKAHEDDRGAALASATPPVAVYRRYFAHA